VFWCATQIKEFLQFQSKVGILVEECFVMVVMVVVVVVVLLLLHNDLLTERRAKFARSFL
jgi:hypothetical protein